VKQTTVLAIDLGGTKAAFAVMSEGGALLMSSKLLLEGRAGADVGSLLVTEIKDMLHTMRLEGSPVSAIGIAVPGAVDNGVVWAPGISGWVAYPLLSEIQQAVGDIPVILESDRTCYITGERWMGNARHCREAIFLSVGTGIGAGILVNGKVLKGIRDVGGAVGWMVMPSTSQYIHASVVQLEQYASGSGMPMLAAGIERVLRPGVPNKSWSAAELLSVYDSDPVAKATIDQCIQWWGMAVANLVSIFNPEKIILGGGVFGPATRFIPEIRQEAGKWVQPLSGKIYRLESSQLGQLAGVYGAAKVALETLTH
jgi:glucokinase